MERTTLTALTARAGWTQEALQTMALWKVASARPCAAVMSPKTLNTVNIYSSLEFARRNSVPVRLHGRT